MLLIRLVQNFTYYKIFDSSYLSIMFTIDNDLVFLLNNKPTTFFIISRDELNAFVVSK